MNYDVTATQNTNNSGIGITMIIRIVLLICLVCFFMPFATVSCANVGEVASGTGVQLAFGTFDDSTQEYEEQLEEEGGLGMNIFVLMAFVGTVSAFITSLFNTEKKTGVMVESIGVIVCMILFRVTFFEYYQITGEYSDMFHVEFHAATLLVIVFHIISAVLSGTTFIPSVNIYNYIGTYGGASYGASKYSAGSTYGGTSVPPATGRPYSAPTSPVSAPTPTPAPKTVSAPAPKPVSAPTSAPNVGGATTGSRLRTTMRTTSSETISSGEVVHTPAEASSPVKPTEPEKDSNGMKMAGDL